MVGVCAVDVATLTTIATQAQGPAPDGRIKPDVQAPTNSSDSANLRPDRKSRQGTSMR